MKKEIQTFATEHFLSPIGDIVVFATDTQIVAIEYRTKPKETHPNKITNACVRELSAYFNGTQKRFFLPMKLHGTAFQKKVWNAIGTIPFGKTLTYGQIAQKIGHPKAVRAVGTATGRNPLCIVIPCHRVLPADGSIGNYTSGPAKKAFLLTLEHRQA